MKTFRSRILACAILMLIILVFSLPGAGAVSRQENSLYLPLVVKPGGSTEPAPTSIELIDKDLKAGLIDANTAAIYKAYTIIPDGPLPAKYAGAPDPQADIALFQDLMKVYSSFTPAQKAQADPYLRRPDEPTSALFQFQQRQAAARSSTGQSGSLFAITATRPADDIKWTSIETATHVKVHYRQDISGDDIRANGVAAAIDKPIYPDLNTLMGRLWMDDKGCKNGDLEDDGGNGELDVYLMHGVSFYGLTIPCGPTYPTSAWIILNADRAIGDDKTKGMVQTAAHEMLHAIQFSYSYEADDDYLWVMEATATWVMDFAYPNAQAEQDYAYAYLGNTKDPMDDNPAAGQKWYGEYLWPFYLYRVKKKPASFIRTMFEEAATNTSVEVFMQRSGSDDPVLLFPDFALKNWNQDPFNEYQTADTLKARVSNTIKKDIKGITVKDKYPLKPDGFFFRRLSATYYDFTFSDNTARTVAFYNGLANKISEKAGLIDFLDTASIFYQTAPLDLATYDGINVQALIKINNAWTREDWSDTSSRVFCRDRKAQNLQELVLIVTNSNFKMSQTNYNYGPPGLDPLLQVSPTACYQWKGTFDVANTSDPNVTDTLTGNVTFEAPADLAGPDVFFTMKSGSAYLVMQGENSDHTMRFNASGWADLKPSDPNNYLDTYNLVTGGPHPKAYYGWGQSSSFVIGRQETCCLEDGVTWEVDNAKHFPIGDWFMTPSPIYNQWISQSAGNIIEGSYTEPNGYVTYHWHLEAQTEP